MNVYEDLRICRKIRQIDVKWEKIVLISRKIEYVESLDIEDTLHDKWTNICVFFTSINPWFQRIQIELEIGTGLSILLQSH